MGLRERISRLQERRRERRLRAGLADRQPVHAPGRAQPPGGHGPGGGGIDAGFTS